MVEVTGTAMWEGQPMPSGEIVFHPTDRAIPPAAGKIVNGQFRFLSKPAAMRVEIDAARKTGKRDPVEGFEITELYIPAKYNRSSELKAEVTLDGKNHFDFALVP